MTPRKTEWSYAFDLLLELEDNLRELEIPDIEFEMLLNRAHVLVNKRSGMEELLELMTKLAHIARRRSQ